jgi:hypothetical protein
MKRMKRERRGGWISINVENTVLEVNRGDEEKLKVLNGRACVNE